MTSKHTPGPWVVATHDLSVRHRSEFGLEIAAVVETIVSSDGPLMDTETAEANARLIAAAPELLEALVEATACGMVPISSAKDGGASTHSRQVRCADMIRAAIAKATGSA